MIQQLLVVGGGIPIGSFIEGGYFAGYSHGYLSLAIRYVFVLGSTVADGLRGVTQTA